MLQHSAAWMALIVMPAVVANHAFAADAKPTDAVDVKMTEATKLATARALEWLAHKQNTDGSWSTQRFPHNTAVTSFALLAFMSQGHLPSQGLYGPEVARGCRFLLASSRADGYLVGARGGNMYCHAMATLALAELWGMTGDEEIKPVLKKAVELIVRCQNAEGGWRYEPAPTGADISVTIMQVMALRAAKNSGLFVPDKTLKNAIAYIKRLHQVRSGGFGYQHASDPPGFARSAAGICVLQLSGAYEAREIPKAVSFLKQHFGDGHYFWYGHYYAAHAMHQVGGKEWQDWYRRISTDLLANQAADGSWTNWHNENVGPAYQTAIAVIILSVPANYLPIFQR